MYQKVSTDMDFVSREKKVLEFWKREGIIEKSFHNNEGHERFTFFDGPPTANGRPHIGHIETRAIKDLIPRFHAMKGQDVLRKAGWDTHGLPVELEVEKLLHLDGKPAIEKYGIEPFIKKCKESVWKYQHVAIVARARCCEGGLRGFTQTPPRVSRLFQLFAALGRAGFCRAWGEYLATESRGGAMCRGATLPGSMGKAIRVRQ